MKPLWCARGATWAAVGMAIAVLAAFPAPAAAQPARLVVTVVDGTGGVIRGAQVSLTDEAAAPGTEPASGMTNDHGQIAFTLLAGRRYTVVVQAMGFASETRRGITIGAGTTRLTMELHLAGLAEHVTVRPGPEQRGGDFGGIPFKRVLTADDLRLLPDDPQAFEEALRAIAGPGAVFRIDGFRGSRLPPKNTIAQIRIGLSDFSAEHHEYTGSIVDIDTKPGIERFSGSVAVSGRATALNAPDFITGRRSPTSHVGLEATLQGPLVRDRASFFGALSYTRENTARTVQAQLPSGPFADTVTQATTAGLLWTSLAARLGQYQLMHGRVTETRGTMDNLGVGELVLPEHAVFRRMAERALQLSVRGPIGRHWFNQIRFQAVGQAQSQTAASASPAVVVMGAFTGGGAQVGGARRSTRWMLANDADLPWRAHAVRVGAVVEGVAVDDNSWENCGGTYTFADLDAYAAGTPLLFTYRIGQPAVHLRDWRAALYLQDDIRVAADLAVSGGVRMEDQPEVVRGPAFAPRASVSWSPAALKSTAVRLGVGRYLEWIGTGILETAHRLNGVRETEVVVLVPTDSATPFTDLTGARVLSNRYQLAARIQQPMSWRLVAAVDQHLGRRLSAMVSYSDVWGTRLLRGVNLNAPIGAAGRPDPAAGNVIEARNAASRRERQLRLQMTWRPGWADLSMAGTYLLGSVIDDTDGPYAVAADPDHPEADRGPASNDVRHRLTVTAVYRPLPYLLAFAQVGAASGLPYNIITGRDDNGDGFIIDRPPGVPRNSARGTGFSLTNLKVIWRPGLGRARVSVPQPADTSTTRRRPVFELSADFQNLLNQRNPIGYVGIVSSPFFGKPVGTMPSRRSTLRGSVQF